MFLPHPLLLVLLLPTSGPVSAGHSLAGLVVADHWSAFVGSNCCPCVDLASGAVSVVASAAACDVPSAAASDVPSAVVAAYAEAHAEAPYSVASAGASAVDAWVGSSGMVALLLATLLVLAMAADPAHPLGQASSKVHLQSVVVDHLGAGGSVSRSGSSTVAPATGC